MVGSAKSARLTNPFHEPEEKRFEIPGEIARDPGIYEEALKAGWELQQRPKVHRSLPLNANIKKIA